MYILMRIVAVELFVIVYYSLVRCLYPGYINRKALDKKSFPANDARVYLFFVCEYAIASSCINLTHV